MKTPTSQAETRAFDASAIHAESQGSLLLRILETLFPSTMREARLRERERLRDRTIHALLVGPLSELQDRLETLFSKRE